MGKVIDAIGISVIAVGVAGGITAGALGLYNLIMPENYKTEEKRGCKVIFDRDGDVFVKSDTKNMLNYLVREDPDKLRYAMESLEDRLFYRDYEPRSRRENSRRRDYE